MDWVGEPPSLSVHGHLEKGLSMRSIRPPRLLLVVALWSLALPASGQDASKPIAESISPTSASGTDLNYTPPATLLPEVSDHAEPAKPRHLLQQLTLDYTWLP